MNGPIDPGTSVPAEAGTGSKAKSEVRLLPQAGRRRILSSRRKWLFRLAALGFPFAFLCLLELVFRWFGIGKDLRLIVPAETSSPRGMVRFNPDSDLTYYDAINLSGPEARPFALPKAAGTFRIVVVGASTVLGFPYEPELAFPRLLEIILQRQGFKHDFEVLNAGTTAITSTCEADVLQQAVACGPDLIVVYTGHNDFIGPGGVGSKVPVPSPRWASLFYSARRTRLLQVGSRVLGSHKQESGTLFEQLLENAKISLNSGKFRQAEDNLRFNLRRMIQIAEDARVPLLLATPTVNLRGQSPLGSLSREGLSARDSADWQTAMDLGEKLLQQKDHRAALEAFDRARAIDDGRALTAFRRAQCLEGLARWEEALESYQAACDLDGYRIRAPSSFAKIMAEVAGGAPPGSLVRFVDSASLFARGAPHGIPGDESFLEHVHFTYSGNWRLAIVLAEHITREILGETWQEPRVPSADEYDELCGVMIQDHLAAKGMIKMMLERAPLNQAPDVALQVQTTQSDILRLLDELSPDERAVVGSLPLQQLHSDVLRETARSYEEAKMYREEETALRRGLRRQPWRPDLLMDLAECELRNGNEPQARALLEQAEKWKPNRRRLMDLRLLLEHPDKP